MGRRPGIPGTGSNPRLEIALELERIALEDDYFVQRKLYPNVDFYSGIMYQAMGFKPEMFTVLFAIPRTIGWLAQWQEMLNDPEQKSRARAKSGSDTNTRGICAHGKSGKPEVAVTGDKNNYITLPRRWLL